MSGHNSSSDFDQHDPKMFKETLGSFGTTTKPGGNQLQELQAKVRQGVKHVELHLASQAKGQFGVQDVPDKYGFEQRRTIMQLAKMNQQTLSVHGTFDIVSFSGLGQGGFNESHRANSIKEIDETIKFAAETAKGGAVVFHIQGDPIPTSRGELNISKEYLDWLENKAKSDPKYQKELDTLKNEYFNNNPLNRRFVDNVDQEKEVRIEFERLKNSSNSREKAIAQRAIQRSKESGRDPWAEFYIAKNMEKTKVSPDFNPLIVVGDKISETNRQQEMVDFEILREKNGKGLNSKEKEIIKTLGVDISQGINLDDFQKLNAIFTNGRPKEYEGKISDKDFRDLKNKLLLTYEKFYSENNFLQAQADKAFHKKLIANQIELMQLQKEDLELNYAVNEEYLERIKEIERRQRELTLQINDAKKKGDSELVKNLKVELQGGLTSREEREFESLYNKIQKEGQNALNQEEIMKIQELDAKRQGTKSLEYDKMRLMQTIGQVEYQKLERYDEMISQMNEQSRKLEEQSGEIKAITDESFNKNTSAIAHLGIKALRYQLDLKNKSSDSISKREDIRNKIRELESEYSNASSDSQKEEVYSKIQKLKYKERLVVGLKDYGDIDLINRPLYLAPENMLPGYGSLTSIEEYKAVIRMSHEDFAKRILSDEPEYKKLREDYEKETGMQIKTHEDAVKLAKRHIGGTFDNAHAGVWLKHFKREGDESEEHRIERFNQWLNSQAEEMAREGIIKHVHFNDTQGKDDDHNLLGSGLLDIHDLRERLRKAGIKEPLVVEAGGRGAEGVMHVLNAFDVFNPIIQSEERVARGYKDSGSAGMGSSGVSDWISVNRNYQNRPIYSPYGMSYSTFRHQPPQQGAPKGNWSQTGFL